MTLLLRIGLEMLILGGPAPLLALALGGGRWHRAGLLGSPAIGLAALTGMLVAVQSPAVVEAASRSWAFSALTLLAFWVAAALFWWPVLRPAPEGGISPIAKIGYLLVAGVPVTIPGVILAFSPRLLYPGARAAGAFGLTPLADQQLAGLVLFGGAKVILVGLTFVILWRMLAAADPRSDEGWGKSGPQPAPLPAPDWYRRLEHDLPPEPAGYPAPASLGNVVGAKAVAPGRVPSPR